MNLKFQRNNQRTKTRTASSENWLLLLYILLYSFGHFYLGQPKNDEILKGSILRPIFFFFDKKKKVSSSALSLVRLLNTTNINKIC